MRLFIHYIYSPKFYYMDARKRSIHEKLTTSLEMLANRAAVPVKMATYSRCFKVLTPERAKNIVSTIPTAKEILTTNEYSVFTANGRVSRALSYIDRWRLSREFGHGDELLNTPFCFAVRRKNNITNFAVVSSSREEDEVKVVEFWTEFSGLDDYSRSFPETVLAIEANVVFVLVFKPAEVMTLLDWDDVWDVPEITTNLKAKLEKYTRVFRQTYAKAEICKSVPNYDFSTGSVDEYIGNDEIKVIKCCGCILCKDWRRLKRLFNAGKIIYIAGYNCRRHKNENPLKNVVFTKSIGEPGITFVYIKGNWDIEFPITTDVVIRMVPDFTKVKRISRKLSKL